MLAAFRAAGFKSSISFQEHPLLDWLASKLNENDPNYVSDELLALHAAAPKRTTAANDSYEDSLLAQLFPDVKQSDISSIPDQNMQDNFEHHGAPPAWLDEPCDEEELEEQLKLLAEERASIRAQMQEIQLLDSQLSTSMTPKSAKATEGLVNQLSFERAAVSSLDAVVQERASKLTWMLKEISEAAKPQNTYLWLILTDSPERESYLRDEVKVTERVARQLQSVEARGTKGLSEVKPEIQLMPDNDRQAFKSLSLFDPSAPSASDETDQAMDAAEIHLLLSEGARLRDSMKEVEAAFVEAKLDAAQHEAELKTLCSLVSQLGSTQGSTLMTRAERDWLAQLHEEASRLEAQEDRIVSSALSQVLDDLGKLQDARLLTCQYGLQGRVQSSLLSQRAVLIQAMLSASSRRHIVDAIQEAEKAELKKLESALGSLDHLLRGIISTSDDRCAQYGEIGTPSLAPGPPQLASKLVAVLGELSQGHPQDYLDKVESEVSRIALGPKVDPRSLNGILAISKSIAQGARSVLVCPDESQPSPKAPQAGPEKIVLHPPALESKLEQVRAEAYELNELINQAKQEHDHFHALISESKEEMMAERSVLEWFHLEPERLSSHIAEMEASVVKV